MLEHLRHAGTSAKPHRLVSRAFHWIGAALVIYGLIFTADFADLFDAAALRGEILFAAFLGTFFLGRFFWVAWFGGASRLPSDAPRWEHLLSRGVHYGVYVSVLGIVLTGLVIALLARGQINGGITPQSTILDIHEAFANALIALIALHLCGAAWHWIVRRDGVWQAMVGSLPWIRGLRGSPHPT